jgi:hypothetical protein
VRFRSDGYPNYNIEGSFEWNWLAVPLVSFLDFPDAGKFDGNDMLATKCLIFMQWMSMPS